jgi:hypothetical protein
MKDVHGCLLALCGLQRKRYNRNLLCSALSIAQTRRLVTCPESGFHISLEWFLSAWSIPTYQIQSLGQSTSNLSGIPNQALEISPKPGERRFEALAAEGRLMRMAQATAYAFEGQE